MARQKPRHEAPERRPLFSFMVVDMTGVPIARWTMSYFAFAILSLIAAQTAMAAGFGFPFDDIRGPDTLVVVHLIGIGWLSFLMCGALFQFVPVLLARPLSDERVPGYVLALLIAGLAAQICGFLQLGGHVGSGFPALPLGGALLSLAFAVTVWTLARTIIATPNREAPVYFVLVGLAALALTALLGLAFAFYLGGATTAEFASDLASFAIPFHAWSGLGGWLTFTAMGVSYRLLAMFMLGPEISGWTVRTAAWLGAFALLLGIVFGVGAMSVEGSALLTTVAALAAACAALALYGVDVLAIFRQRRRRTLELNTRTAAMAFFNLAIATPGVIVCTIWPVADSTVAAFVFLGAFGWLSGLGLGKLHKITAFLTWLEFYGPKLGKGPCPRVQDIVREDRTRWPYGVYFVAVWGGFFGLLSGSDMLFRLSAAVMTLSTAAIFVQLIRIRHLQDLDGSRFTPVPSSARPHLLYATTDR